MIDVLVVAVSWSFVDSPMCAVCGSATGGEMSERACVSGGIGVRVRKNLHCERSRLVLQCAGLAPSRREPRPVRIPGELAAPRGGPAHRATHIVPASAALY